MEEKKVLISSKSYYFTDKRVEKGDWGVGQTYTKEGKEKRYFIFFHDDSSMAKVYASSNRSFRIERTTDKTIKNGTTR